MFAGVNRLNLPFNDFRIVARTVVPKTSTNTTTSVLSLDAVTGDGLKVTQMRWNESIPENRGYLGHKQYEQSVQRHCGQPASLDVARQGRYAGKGFYSCETYGCPFWKLEEELFGPPR